MVRGFLFLLVLAGAVSSTTAAVDKAVLRWARNHPRIDSIAIEGNQYFSDGEIKSRLYSRPRNVWLAIKGDRRSRVQREMLNRDTLEVKYMYLSEGFLGVKITHTCKPIGVDSTALIRITIDEGNRFLYGAREVTGAYDSQFHGRLGAIVSQLAEGDPANPFQMTDVKHELKTFMANHGYPYAEVTSTLDTTGNPDRCAITYEVLSDSLVHFGEVTVAGASIYPENVARRELKIVPGEVYRREDILESQRRLFESGYYTTFQLQRRENGRDRLRPDFELHVRERPAYYVTFKTGAAQSEVRDLLWDVSGAFGSRKFFGPRRLALLTDYSFSVGKDSRLIHHRYRVRFTNPWLFSIRMPLILTGEFRPRIKDPVQDFDKRYWSVSAAASKWYSRKIRINLGIEYQYVKIYGVSEDSIAVLRSLAGNSARRKIYSTFRRDSRNNLFLPSHGSVTELSAEYFGGFLQGDDNFYKIQTSWSRYQITWPGWITATRLRFGWAEEFGKTESVPLDEALYLGGANTVRGFNENMLGPLFEDGTPEGARYTAVFNLEFRWKTIQFHRALPFVGSLFRSLPLWQSVFVDVGNGFRNRDEIGFNNFAVGYGTGIQIVSPAGPIRVDYAQVAETDRFDFAARWHFTILYAF